MAKYQMLVSFDADTILSSDEEDNLIGHVAPQIEEPTTHEGDDEEYSTSNLQIYLTQSNVSGKMKAKYDKDDDVLFFIEEVKEIN